MPTAAQRPPRRACPGNPNAAQTTSRAQPSGVRESSSTVTPSATPTVSRRRSMPLNYCKPLACADWTARHRADTDGCERIPHVVLTEQRRLESTEHFVLPQDGEPRQAIVMLNVLRWPVASPPRPHVSTGLTARRPSRAACCPHRATIVRSSAPIREPAKRQQDRIEIGVNVRVIELDVPDDRDVRQVLRNLAVLSKNALSYSSPSITKSRPFPTR